MFRWSWGWSESCSWVGHHCSYLHVALEQIHDDRIHEDWLTQPYGEYILARVAAYISVLLEVVDWFIG